MSFSDKLSVLVSLEMAEAHGDAERIGVVIERLTHSLAFSIALAARGDAKAMERFLQGAEAYLYETAAQHAPIGKLMSVTRK